MYVHFGDDHVHHHHIVRNANSLGQPGIETRIGGHGLLADVHLSELRYEKEQGTFQSGIATSTSTLTSVKTHQDV
jgi:hypothetical protein